MTVKQRLLYPELTYRVRGCAFEVYRQLGAGFLEQVYQRALMLELRSAGISAVSGRSFPVAYKGQEVGHYLADIVVAEKIIIEVKAQSLVPERAKAQLLNYLKAAGLRLGLLINFRHPGATIQRFAL